MAIWTDPTAQQFFWTANFNDIINHFALLIQSTRSRFAKWTKENDIIFIRYYFYQFNRQHTHTNATRACIILFCLPFWNNFSLPGNLQLPIDWIVYAIDIISISELWQSIYWRTFAIFKLTCFSFGISVSIVEFFNYFSFRNEWVL